MIAVSNSSTPVDARSVFDAPAADEQDAAAPSANTPTPGDAGAALAKFGAENGLHAQVRQFAQASPNGASGGAAGSAPTQGATARERAQAYMTEGVRLLKAGDYKAAIALFEEGYRLVPSPNFILNGASAFSGAGRYAEAVLAYQRYLGEPDMPRADEAREAMEQARAHLGGRVYSAADVAQSKRLAETAEKALQDGRFEDAFEAYHDAYDHNPIAAFQFDQAVCLEKLGADYSAAKLYRSYLASEPNDKDAARIGALADKLEAQAERSPTTAGGHVGGMEWISRGNHLLTAHRYSEAIAAYDEGFNTFPDRGFILNKAAALFQSGRYAEADLAYGRYLAEPDAPRADEARAAQLRVREHMGGREATVTGVAESQRLMGEGEALYKAGKFADALQAFNRAYTLNPLPELRYNQAACIEMMGAREMAASRYGDYLREAPHASDADKVRTHIAKLHDAAKSAAQAAFDRGQEAYQQGNYKAAASAFLEAYSQLPLPEFLENAGAALHKGGDSAGAVHYYQLYLNMAPHAADATQVRNKIETLQQASGNALMKPVDAVAEAALAAAQRAYDRGQLAYQQGRWTDAAHAFAEAYAQRPFPQFLYNQAAALDMAGDTMGAARVYQQYLNADPHASDANKVRERIHTILDRAGNGLMAPGG